MFCIELILEQDYYYSRTKRMFFIEIIALLIMILVLYKHSLCPRILLHGLLLFQDKENVLYRTNIRTGLLLFFIEIIALLILILVLYKHLFVLEYYYRDYYYSRTKRMFCIELILEQDYYYSRTKRMFCIELIAILILILVLSKHSLCPRIPLQGLLLFQDKENVLYRTNSNPYSDISSIQTFSLSQNTTTGITIILGQRECFVQN